MVCSSSTKMLSHRKVLLPLLRQGSMLMVPLIGWELVASVIICFRGTWSYLRRTEVNICPMSSPRSHLYSVHHELNRLLVSHCQKCLQGMGFITSYWRNLTTASLSSSASWEGAWVYLCRCNITGMNDWKSPLTDKAFANPVVLAFQLKTKKWKHFCSALKHSVCWDDVYCWDLHTAVFKLGNEVQKYPL